MVVARASADAAAPRGSFLSSAILTYGTNLAVAALSLLNVLIISRALGPTGRGEVAFLTAIAWLTSNLATFGVQEANANIAGTEPDRRRSLAANSVVLSAVIGTATIGALALLVALFPAVGGNASPALLWMTFGSLPIIILGIYMRFLVQADYGFGITNVAWLITPLANVIVNGLLAAVGVLSVETAVATWIGGQILQTVVLVGYVARRSEGFGRFNRPLARRSLAFGARSHPGRVMLLGNYRLDQWILGAIAGPRELGLYSVAVAWAEALWFLPTALSAVQRPDLVRGSPKQAAAAAALVYRIAALITIASGAVVLLAAPFLCVTIFGESFRGSVDDLRILVLGSLGIVALKQLGNALTAQRRPGSASIAVAFAFFTAIALYVVLIPRYGGLGAALASSIAYTVGGLAVCVIFVRALGAPRLSVVPRVGDVTTFTHALRGRLRLSTQKEPQ